MYTYIGLYMALPTEQFKKLQETRWERGGVIHSKGPQDRTQTRGRCGEDKASVHGAPALPTELNSTNNN